MVRFILALTIITCLITGWSCSNSSPQIKFGTYRQYTSYHYADLEILKGHKFIFNDMRWGSCFAWTKYEGNWTMNKDTLIFTWQTHWEENPVHISSSIDRSSKEINLTFKYEDNEPIQNVQVCYTCVLWGNPDCFYTDEKGTLRLPQSKTTDYKDKYCTGVNQLFFIKDDISGVTSEEKQTSDNVFTILVERKLKSVYVTETRKFLIAKHNLIFLDSNNKSWYDNWGNFKFLTKEERELSEKEESRPVQVKELITP
jgi:hypothetical protein